MKFKGEAEVVQMVRMSEIKPRPMLWLWNPYIPLGKITILRGDPGCGKTSFALQLAAIYSRNDYFPGRGPREGETPEIDITKGADFPGGYVLFLSAEDDLEDSIAPRLIAAGANMDKIMSVADQELKTPINFTEPVFEELIKGSEAKLVIIDPIQAFMGGSVDAHRANEVRPIMSHLRRLARKYMCAIVLIEHLNKNIGGKALYRGLGSIDITAAARSILMLGSDDRNPAQKGVAHIKSNVGPKGDVIGFSITENGFKWEPDSAITKEIICGNSSAVDNRHNDGGEKQSALDKACEFLREVLKEGPRTVKDLHIMASQFNISEGSLRRARIKLGLTVVRNKGVGSDTVYSWQLS